MADKEIVPESDCSIIYKRNPQMFKQLLEDLPKELVRAVRNNATSKSSNVEYLSNIERAFIKNSNNLLENWWVANKIEQKVKFLIQKSDEMPNDSAWRPTTGTFQTVGLDGYWLSYQIEETQKLLNNILIKNKSLEEQVLSKRKEFGDICSDIQQQQN